MSRMKENSLFISNLISCGIIFLVGVTCFYKWKFQYWKKRNLPFLEPQIPFGNFQNPLFLNEKPGIFVQRLYKKMRSRGWKHGGFYFFGVPLYMVVDPEYIKNVMTRDFQYFIDRGFYCNEKDDLLGVNNLFNSGVKHWRHLRKLLNPSFTSRKIKTMFLTLLKCKDDLLELIEKHYEMNKPIDVNYVCSCYTMNVIITCAFGLECKNNSELRHFAKKSMQFSKFKIILLMICSMFPKLGHILKVRTIDKSTEEFFIRYVSDIINFRKKENYSRDDFMQYLIDLKNDNTGNALTLTEIVSQCHVFFIAGYDTSHSTMSWVLYELAKNQNVQDKVREEIDKVLKKFGTMTYEAVYNMQYLDQVLDETLRKYPALLYLTRQCIQDYKVPETDTIIEKGTTVIIPTLGLNYDDEYYPNPEKFDPERFTAENRDTRPSYAHLPFGEGPRICIGKRFALVQVKVGIIFFLNSYKITLNRQTKKPIKMKIDSLISIPEDRILLDVHKL